MQKIKLILMLLMIALSIFAEETVKVEPISEKMTDVWKKLTPEQTYEKYFFLHQMYIRAENRIASLKAISTDKDEDISQLTAKVKKIYNPLFGLGLSALAGAAWDKEYQKLGLDALVSLDLYFYFLHGIGFFKLSPYFKYYTGFEGGFGGGAVIGFGFTFSEKVKGN